MAHLAPDPELLEAESSRGGPERLVWVAVLVALLLVVVTAWRVDAHTRAREAAAVSACEHGLRQASWLSDRRMGLLADYLRPALHTTHGVQQLHLADLMAQRAGRVLPAVQAADRDCRELSVRPWHFTLVARSDAARAYSGALVTLLQTIAAQGSATFRDDAVLLRLRTAAGVD